MLLGARQGPLGFEQCTDGVILHSLDVESIIPFQGFRVCESLEYIAEEKMEEKFGFRTMAAPPPLRQEEDKEKVSLAVNNSLQS